MNIFEKAQQLYDKSIAGTIDNNDMDAIINWPQDQMSVLFACTDQLRRKYFGATVDPCSLMNIKSGGCSEDCAFCAQSGHNHTTVTVRDLATPDEIRKQCAYSVENNLPFCVVSSGRRLTKSEIKMIADTLKDCKGEKHASLGILDFDDFIMLKNAGVICYNHNLETSRSFFPKIVTTHTWDERAETVKSALKAGMHVCCGGIFGLGESWDDRKEFCLQLKELGVDTIPINFLNAVPGTRVAKPADTPFDFLKVVALFRIVMPERTVKVCGGREVNLGSLQNLIFFAGANGYVSGGYLTTPGAGISADDQIINSLGLENKMRIEK
jgi:biotin synthase